MKRCAAIILLLTLAAAPAKAQTDTLVGIRKGSIELGGAGGLSLPIGDYGDWAALSGTGAFIVGYYASPQLSFGLDAGGHWHTGSNLADSLLGPDAGFNLYRVFTPYLKYQLKVAKVSPYVTGLAGLYLQEANTSLGSITQTVSQGYLGLAAGAGVQMVTDDSVLLFLEGRFHNAMRSDAAPIQFMDVRVGFTFLL